MRSSLESGRTAASLESGARIECRVPVVAPGRYSVTVLASGSVLASPPGAYTLHLIPYSLHTTPETLTVLVSGSALTSPVGLPLLLFA